MDNIKNKNWISTEEAQMVSGYKVEYIRKLAREGKIDSQKVYKTVLISKESLMEYKASHASIFGG